MSDDLTGLHDRLSPAEQEATNVALIQRAESDSANWRTDSLGSYYVGPKFRSDGTIEWPDEEEKTDE